MSQPEPGQREPSEAPKSFFVRNKRLTLWLSVAATMAFVVIMWIMILPSQLQTGGIGSAIGAARWSVIQPQVQRAGGSFQQQLDRLSADLHRRFEQTTAGIQELQAASIVNSSALTAKLEAAVNSQNPGTQAINAENLTQKLEAATASAAAPENPDTDAQKAKK